MTTLAEPKISIGTRMPVEQFLELDAPEYDGFRLELDDGELFLMPRPRRQHQFLATWLAWYIASYLNGFAEPPAELYHELVVILSRARRRVLAPDLAVVLRENTGIFAVGYAEGPPDLVVEILSGNRRRDLVYKRQVYSEAGVREYWVVDPRDDTVMVLELQGSGYVERGVLGVGDTLTTPLLPGLAIPLAGIFEHRLRPARDE